ncbi:hypothetical protein Bhyg_08838 [Pseudolycoriella hygida]|uniref:N-acetyltransferase domain-containing protein n=1 Tax=Pseudolycoriella hygida TaxID=35572 RepID=A0A9Q0S4Q0_9DIPT|nr:hypothetical protein Bhyg_08838 [Pseudolycoriella hygida]
MGEETFCVARNVTNDEKSIADLTRIWRELIYNEKMTIACFKEGCDDIIGMNVLFIETEKIDENWDIFVSENIRDMDAVCLYMLEQFNVCKHYQVDRHLACYGLSVSPAYRNRGIARKLLETRKLLGKPYGLSLTSTLFSSPEAQKVALAAGFEKNYEVPYEELAKIDPRYDFRTKPNSKFGIYKGCGDIIGIHVLFIEREKFDIDWDRLASESVRDMDLICLYVSVSVRCLQTLPSRQLLRLSVNSAYRRRGIAKKLLETRKLLGKPYGLSLTSTAFSSPEAQKVALSYQELAKIDPRFDFKIKANAKLGIYSMRI